MIQPSIKKLSTVALALWRFSGTPVTHQITAHSPSSKITDLQLEKEREGELERGSCENYVGTRMRAQWQRGQPKSCSVLNTSEHHLSLLNA